MSDGDSLPTWKGFSPCELILFDLDDTILDFDGSVGTCWRQVCAEAEQRRPVVDADRLYRAIDETRKWYWADPERHRVGRTNLRAASASIVTSALGRLGVDYAAFGAGLAERYRDLRDEQIGLFDRAEETLDHLREQGFKLGLLTNGTATDQRTKIERFDLARFFDYIWIEGETGVGKPDPEAYLNALRTTSCDATLAWMVGDNFEWDVAAPQRLGIRTIWVDRRAQGLPNGTTIRPDHSVREISELLPPTPP